MTQITSNISSSLPLKVREAFLILEVAIPLDNGDAETGLDMKALDAD